MEAIKELIELTHDYTGYNTEEGREINHAISAAKQEMEWLRLSETRYEELRKVIDGMSESMTHEDAVKQCKYWREMSAQHIGLRLTPIIPNEAMTAAFHKAVKTYGTKDFFCIWTCVMAEVKNEYA